MRVQDMLLVEGGFVMPDLMVLEPPPRGQQPSTAALVIEVSVTSHAHDEAKAARYARAGVDEYWIVDLPGRAVHVHRRPDSRRYVDVAAHHDGGLIGAFVCDLEIEVSWVLGAPAS